MLAMILVACSGGAASSPSGPALPPGPAAPDASQPARIEVAPDAGRPLAPPVVPDAGPDEVIRGWYCYVLRREPNDELSLGSCFRTHAACDSERKLNIALGGHAAPCQPQPRAYCFWIESAIEQYRSLECHINEWDCYSQTLRVKRTPDQRLTECRAYD